MFVPLSDDNPLKSIPFQYVTIALIVANVAAYFVAASAGDLATVSMALVPGELIREGLLGPAVATDQFDQIAIPERWTVISYMFLHADLLHLAGNMLFLWVFGDNIEDALGHFRFLIFYLLCGIIAGLVHVYATSGSISANAPLVGASGAVAGCVGAYLLLHPKVRVFVLALRFIPLTISAAWALGAWVVMQFVMALIPQQGAVAWWAHVGGLVAGVLLVIVMRRPGVALLDRATGSTTA